MRGLDWRTILATAVAASALTIATTGAQAHDDDWWRWERPRYHDHWRYDPPRPIVVERQPVIVARPPVVMAPAPVFVAPAYSAPAEPSLNFNFTIPLH